MLWVRSDGSIPFWLIIRRSRPRMAERFSGCREHVGEHQLRARGFESHLRHPHGHATRMIRYRDVPWTPSFFWPLKIPTRRFFEFLMGGVENFRDPGGINFLTRGVIFCVRGGGLFFVPLLCEFAQVVWIYLTFVCHLMVSFTKAHEIVII